MDKKTVSRILAFTNGAEVTRLGHEIEAKHPVVVLKRPQKMLTMLKVRESAQNSLFYAGEALACECMVMIGGKRGFAATLGDDLEKVYAMAVIDAALNAGLPECGMILDTLGGWKRRIIEQRAIEARLTMATKVNFNVMEE